MFSPLRNLSKTCLRRTRLQLVVSQPLTVWSNRLQTGVPHVSRTPREPHFGDIRVFRLPSNHSQPSETDPDPTFPHRITPDNINTFRSSCPSR